MLQTEILQLTQKPLVGIFVLGLLVKMLQKLQKYVLVYHFRAD